MTGTNNHNDLETKNLQQNLQRVIYLLSKYKLVEGFVQMQEFPHQELDKSLAHKQDLLELQGLLDKFHPADIAYILEALPLEDRLMIWDLVKAERDGEILLETSDAVRETLIATMDSGELVAATELLDADEIADLAPDLPRNVLDDLFQTLPTEEREQLRSAISYPEDAVGALMDFDMVTIRED
ncbi:MAG: magnesium transporter, partial [Nitrosomonadaceae bacterium]